MQRTLAERIVAKGIVIGVYPRVKLGPGGWILMPVWMPVAIIGLGIVAVGIAVSIVRDK